MNDLSMNDGDTVIPERPGNSGGIDAVVDTGNSNAGKVEEAQTLTGETTDIDGASITSPSLGWSPFAGMGGVGLNLPNFTFGGSGSGGGFELKPAGVFVILIILIGGGYYLYKKYKK